MATKPSKRRRLPDRYLSSGLSPAEEIFANEYCVDFDRGRAAVAAQFTELDGLRLLQKDIVWDRICEIIGNRASDLVIDQRKALWRLWQIAELDIADLCNERGDLLPLRDIPQPARAALEFAITKDGEGRTQTRVQSGDKLAALKTLATVLGMATQRVEVSGGAEPIRVIEIVKHVVGGERGALDADGEEPPALPSGAGKVVEVER